MKLIGIDKFKKSPGLLDGHEFLFIVKSQDQIERRKRLTGQLRVGRIGRVKERPIADGLFVRCAFPLRDGDELTVKTSDTSMVFPEPRHIVPYRDGTYLLSEIGRVDLVDKAGRVLDCFTHPYFGFLHTVCMNSAKDRFLVVSSGYDAVFELDMKTKQETWSWFGWDHGFNPNEDGIYYMHTSEKAEKLIEQGFEALYVDPSHYNEQGLLTASRTTHPNAARYNPYKGDRTVIVSLGRKGRIIEIDMISKDHTVITDSLGPMPHGIRAHKRGWMVTDTTRGELWLTDRDFRLKTKIDFSGLGGKPDDVAGLEWVQQVVPVTDSLYMALDANRGLIVFDTQRRVYELIRVDDRWCVQDALFIQSD
jgi:hypothetical protein